MATISHQEFNDRLGELGAEPGAIPYSAQDGGTLAPTSSAPPPTIPGSRRTARPIPPRADPIGILGGVRDAACGVYGLAPGSFCEALVPPADVLNFPNGAPSSFRSNCQGNMQRLCSGAPPDLQPPPPDAPPIPGGQCQGVQYDVTVETTRYGVGCTQGSNGTGTVRVWGEVLDVRLVPNPEPNNFRLQRLEILCRGSASSAVGELQWVNAGTRQNLAGGCPYGIIDLINTSRVDGQPDNCGDGEPRYRRDPNVRPDLDITINIGGNNPVNIRPSFNFDGPTINVQLPSIGDVAIDIGGITINPPSSDDGGGGDSPTPDRPPPDSTTPDPDSPPPPPPPTIDDPAVEEPAEPETTKVIRGALVTVGSLTPSQGVIFQEGNPDVIIPDAGLIAFRVRVDDDSSGWTEDIRIKNRRQVVPCPWDGGAFDVKGTPRPGVTWDITPIIEVVPVPE